MHKRGYRDEEGEAPLRENLAARHVFAIYGDYNEIFLDSNNTEIFVKKKLDGKKVDLITLHHSLYYCEEQKWAQIFDNIYKRQKLVIF